jgi:SAM-dependent methyltransferase
MGIKTSVAQLLVRAKEQGACFAATATIGRQSLTVPEADLAGLARRLGVAMPDWQSFAADGFSEDFFRLYLGAATVTSFDFSAYQSASIVHDLNVAIEPLLHRTFDAVFDGGTLEHLFDIKQVLSNYMNLVKVGGSLFICTNANNLCGHGFYQFSPEFFYRVFTEANGFEVESLCLIETPLIFVEKSARQRVFSVVDPASVGKRAVIVTDRPVSIYVHARRTADRPLFAQAPCQSDYSTRWNDADDDDTSVSPAKARADANGQRFAYVSDWETWRRTLRQRRKNSLRNRKMFKPLVP